MTVTLISRARRMQTFILTHDRCCRREARCRCRAIAPGRPRVPRAVRVPALGRVEGLPEGAVDLPAVARAIRAGTLQVVRAQAKATKPVRQARRSPPQAEPAATTEAADKTPQSKGGKK